MKIKYQTGIATFIQFALGASFGFVNNIYSAISGCTGHSTDCVSNVLVCLILIILTTIWYGFIAVLGYTAQDRRSKKLARLLIAMEGFTALVALFDAMHYANLVGLLISIVDFSVAAWVMLLAYRLSKAKGGRVTASGSSRKRQRRHSL